VIIPAGCAALAYARVALESVEHGAPKGGIHGRILFLDSWIARSAERLLGKLGPMACLTAGKSADMAFIEAIASASVSGMADSGVAGAVAHASSVGRGRGTGMRFWRNMADASTEMTASTAKASNEAKRASDHWVVRPTLGRLFRCGRRTRRGLAPLDGCGPSDHSSWAVAMRPRRSVNAGGPWWWGQASQKSRGAVEHNPRSQVSWSRLYHAARTASVTLLQQSRRQSATNLLDPCGYQLLGEP